MKGSTVRLIVWSVIAALILGVMLALFFMPSIFRHVNFPFRNVHRYVESEKYQVGAGSADSVKKIRIDWIDGEVEVVSGNVTSVMFSEEGAENLSQARQLHWYNDDGTLYLRYSASGARFWVNADKKLKVTVPENLFLDELKIDVVSADTKIGNVCADMLETDSVSGKVESDGDFRAIETNTVSGNVTLRFSVSERVPEKIDFDSVSGNMRICLPEETGFDAKIDSVSGDIATDFSVSRMTKDRIVCGDGKLSVDADSVSGDLEIRKIG